MRIWIDDDFRNSNHGQVEFGCYCDRHLAAVGERVGHTPTREELVEAILRPGVSHPWRGQWLDFLAGTLNDAARMPASEVWRISPDTEMGWMSTFADSMVMFPHQSEAAAHRRLLTLEGPYCLLCRGDGSR